MQISFEAFCALRSEYQQQAIHYTKSTAPFDQLLETVGMVLHEIECCNTKDVNHQPLEVEYLAWCRQPY